MLKTTVEKIVKAGRPVASQAEAEAGTDNTKAMTPLTTKQAITALGATLFTPIGASEGIFEARDDALGAATDAETFKNQAEGYKKTAATSAGQAMGFRNAAETAQGLAEGARDDTRAFRDEAEGFRDETLAAVEATGLVTPELVGLPDVAAAADDAVADDYSLYLTDIARTATELPLPMAARVSGPGSDRVTYKGSERVVGKELEHRLRSDPRARVSAAATALNFRPAREHSTHFKQPFIVLVDATWVYITPSDRREGAGGYLSAFPAAWFPPAGVKRVRFRGRGKFAANATGLRKVGISRGSFGEALDGFNEANIFDSETATSVGAADETPAKLDFEFDVIAGSYYVFWARQNSGGGLGAELDWTYEVIEEEDISAPGPRGLIYQGLWSTKEAEFGGYYPLLSHIAANYDQLILSGIETFNDDSGFYPQFAKKAWYNCKGAWPPAAGTNVTVSSQVHANPDIQKLLRAQDPAQFRYHDTVTNKLYSAEVAHTLDAPAVAMTFSAYRAANPTHYRECGPGDLLQTQGVGWPKLRRFIRDYKTLRPDGAVYGYVSAAVDHPYFDNGGNPISQLTSGMAGNYENFISNISWWLQDGLEVRGVFIDHWHPSFIDTVVRDAIMAICRTNKLEVAPNITVATVAALQFFNESPHKRPGDMPVVEGFEYDNGVAVSASTDAFLIELAKVRAQGIRLFAVGESVIGAGFQAGDAIDLAARAKFDPIYHKGDAYQRGRPTYDTM